MKNGDKGEVLYAGGSPGSVAGLLQVNVRVPAKRSGRGKGPLHVHHWFPLDAISDTGCRAVGGRT
jgi:hypothetical protein